MAYIGVQPAEAYTSFAVQHFTTSATTGYTLDNPVANENEIALFINNVRQQPGSSYAYTASGTTLTLSAATSASDTMYCVFIGKAVQTVTPTLPIANFSSTGIDDNADATAITIDTSQNVLVGKTTNNRTDVGSEIRPIGFIRGTRLDGHPFDAVRTNSDGDIMRFYRDAGQVGQITAYTTGISINLGGTGSANALDDYEEGTWTPTLTFANSASGSLNYTQRQGIYTKVGRLVHIQVFVAWNANNFTASSGAFELQGLPFVNHNTSNYRGGASIVYASGAWSGLTIYQQALRAENTASKFRFNYSPNTNGVISTEVGSYTNIGSNGSFMISGTYQTN